MITHKIKINEKICQKSSKLRNNTYRPERGNESQTPVTDTDSPLHKERGIDGQYEGSSQTINNVVSKGLSRGTMEETKNNILDVSASGLETKAPSKP